MTLKAFIKLKSTSVEVLTAGPGKKCLLTEPKLSQTIPNFIFREFYVKCTTLSKCEPKKIGNRLSSLRSS